MHAAGVALWSWTVETDEFAMDEQAFGLWGLPAEGPANSKTFPLVSTLRTEASNRVIMN